VLKLSARLSEIDAKVLWIRLIGGPFNYESVGRVGRVHSTVQFPADSQIRHLGERYRLSVPAYHRSQIRQPKLDHQRVVRVVEKFRSAGLNPPAAHGLSGGVNDFRTPRTR
jgi:hypothetical protein